MITVDTSVKQVIIIRTDLGMSKGKAIAQAAHGAVKAAFNAFKSTPDIFQQWDRDGYMKIALKARDENELRALKDLADRMKLPLFLVIDAGRTQLEPNTVTVLAIGPALSTQIDSLTRSLPLY